MVKRPNESQGGCSPVPSPAKKPKKRPTRAAAQRAQDAVQREAQQRGVEQPTEDEIPAHQPMRSKKKVSSEPTTKPNQAPVGVKKAAKSSTKAVGKMVVTPGKSTTPRVTKDTTINKYFTPRAKGDSSLKAPSADDDGLAVVGSPEHSGRVTQNSRAPAKTAATSEKKVHRSVQPKPGASGAPGYPKQSQQRALSPPFARTLCLCVERTQGLLAC